MSANVRSAVVFGVVLDSDKLDEKVGPYDYTDSWLDTVLARPGFEGLSHFVAMGMYDGQSTVVLTVNSTHMASDENVAVKNLEFATPTVAELSALDKFLDEQVPARHGDSPGWRLVMDVSS